MLFPKGVELLLGGITKYDNVAEMYLVQGCFLVTLVIFKSLEQLIPLLYTSVADQLPPSMYSGGPHHCPSYPSYHT